MNAPVEKCPLCENKITGFIKNVVNFHLNRDEPIKPGEESITKTIYTCPKCTVAIKDTFNYCPNCGQKIGW